CHRLYDSNPETQLAAAILLGQGGARLLEEIGHTPDIYHLNESHGLPLAFYLYDKYRNMEEVRRRMVFTNHTPEPSGNQQSEINQLARMGYFGNLTLEEVRQVSGAGNDLLDHTLTALRSAGRANGVSQMHLQTLNRIWAGQSDICPLTAVTNAQSADFWQDREMYAALMTSDDAALRVRKKACKEKLFEEVADQCGTLFSSDILTIVFAKRFTGYKRPELLLHDLDFLQQLLSDPQRPVQLIWAGKPYPMDYGSIGSFDRLVNLCKTYPNVAILTGYELRLSRLLKQGADIWLNTPRMTHEACGTSGMSAAMNGAINVSIPDGWFPEFARDGINSFVIPDTEVTEHKFQQDETDAHNLYALLKNTVIPLYYDHPDQWLTIVKNSMRDILPQFDSRRLAAEYYEKLYWS
ncbi:MAG TPA: alpha-glucan family phosphorylase, partial [Puia sp.]|nr:alpha-glucan family phosphorylase [Puia sp.]